jgi:hypothetical protein
MSDLTRDMITVPGQRFVLLSVIGPQSPQKHDKFGIKIRGCFDTQEEASKHAKRLQAEDSTFDIMVADMYQWLLIPPDPVKIDDVHYNDEKLQEIMEGYKKNQIEAARHFEERKRDMAAKKSGETMPYIKPGDEHSKYYNKPDEAPVSHPAEVLERLQKEKPDAPMEELVKEADAIVAEEHKQRQKEREEMRAKEKAEEEAKAAEKTEEPEEGEITEAKE